MKADAMQLLSRSTPLIKAVVAGFRSDPGTSDLDDEQPITVRMTLGDWRRAFRLKHELENMQ